MQRATNWLLFKYLIYKQPSLNLSTRSKIIEKIQVIFATKKGNFFYFVSAPYFDGRGAVEKFWEFVVVDGVQKLNVII